MQAWTWFRSRSPVSVRPARRVRADLKIRLLAPLHVFRPVSDSRKSGRASVPSARDLKCSRASKGAAKMLRHVFRPSVFHNAIGLGDPVLTVDDGDTVV